MRMLQVYRDYFTELPGGVERHVHDLAHGLSHLGQVDVLASSRSRRNRAYLDGLVHVQLKSEFGRPGGIPLSPGFFSAMHGSDHDVVHLHSLNPTAELAAATTRPPGALVVSYHADLHRSALVWRFYRPFLMRFLASCDRVLVSSSQLVAASPVLAPVARERPDLISAVPFGVDLERFSPVATPGADELRSDWGGGPIVLFIGRLRHYKGVDVLLAAMQELEATLVIVGGGTSGERALVRGSAMLGSRVVYVPYVRDEELPDVYRASDIFCLPSTSAAETFGMATLEAMASGLPAITTEVGTATSVVNAHLETGLVVPPRDPQALAGAISALLKDEDLRRRFGLAARERASAHFSKAAMLGRIEAIYREVAA